MSDRLLHSAVTRKYIFCFCAVALSVLLLLIPVFRIAYRTSFDNASDELSRAVEKAAGELDREWVALSSAETTGALDVLSLLPVKSYRGASSDAAGSAPPARTAVAALSVWKNLQSVQWQLPNARRLLLLFSESDIAILSDLGVFYEGVPETCEIDGGIAKNAFDRTGYFFAGNAETLLFGVRNAGSRLCACAVYDDECLRTLFGFDTLPPETFLRVYQGDAAVYSSRSAGNDGFVLLRGSADSFGVTVEVGIPESYFLALVQPVYRALSGSLCAALLLGLAFSVAMGIFNSYPIRRLVRRELAEDASAGKKHRRVDELGCIRDIFERSALDLEEKDRRLAETLSRLRHALRKHCFLELLTGTRTGEQNTDCLPELEEPYQIALLLFDPSSSVDAASSVAGILERLGILAAPLGTGRLAVCVPERRKPDFLLAVNEINLAIGKGSRPAASLSPSALGSGALRQAYLAACGIPAEPGAVADGTHLADVPAAGAFYSEGELQRLADLIRAGDPALVRSFFSEEALSQTLRPETVRDARNQFDQLRVLLLQLAGQGSALPFYEEAGDPWEQLERLRGECVCTAERVRKKLSARSGYKTAVVQYIREHAFDPLLCVDGVAAQFGISGRQIYAIVRDLQGAGFSEFLLRLRMERAVSLLSERSVRDTASLCGFSSVNAFYKAFKRYYGASPGQFLSGADAEPGDPDTSGSPA